MNSKQILALGVSLLAVFPGGRVVAAETRAPNARVAELEIHPARLEEYKVTLAEEIEASIRLEPGVLALHAVAEKDNLSRIRILEIYADEAAYLAHLDTPHFRKYKVSTQEMIKSLKLVETVPVLLGAKPTWNGGKRQDEQSGPVHPADWRKIRISGATFWEQTLLGRGIIDSNRCCRLLDTRCIWHLT